MSGEHEKIAGVRPAPASGNGHSRPDFQELWFTLQRWEWGSLVILPADEGMSTAWIAQSLAAVGSRLYGPAVKALVAERLDFDSTAEIAASIASAAPGDGARGGPRNGRVIVATEPVVVQPLAIAIARAADSALMCIEMGRSRIASAQRAIELVGRDRFLGCILIT